MEILFLYENLLKSVCISYYFRFMRSQERKWLVENLSFVWNEQIRSYVSDGGGGEVVTVKDKPIGKNVKIKMELLQIRSGN